MARTRDLVFTILGIDQGSKTLQKVGKAADEAGTRLDKFGRTSQLALGGTVVAALGAGVGIGAALAGTAVVVGSAGLAIASSNVAVKDSFGDLWNEVKTGSQEAAAPLQKDLIGISHQMGSLFADIQPKLRGLFTDSMPAVHALVDGVDGLVRHSLPGLQVAVRSSAEPARALRDLLIDTGDGATAFFTNISRGSQSSAAIIRSFGGIVENALGFAGDLFARLSNEGAPTVERLSQVFAQLTGTISGLSGGALPVLFSAAGAALNVLSGLMAVVGVAPAQFGALLGVVLSAGVALKALDAVTFGGLSGQLGKVKVAISEASGFGGKLKAGISGLAGGFGAAGLAAAGLGLLLGGLGEAQQRAAQAAQQHKANEESLASALRATNGVIDQSVRSAAAKNLQDTQVADSGRNVLQVSRDLGLSLPQVTDGYLGQVDAQKQLNSQLDAIIKNGTSYASQGRSVSVPMLTSQAQAAQDLKKTLAGTNSELSNSKSNTNELADASHNAASATQEHIAALIRLQQTLLGFVDKNLAYRQAVNAEAQAEKAAAAAIKAHGRASEDSKQKQLQWESSILQSVNAAGEFAASQYTGSNATEKAKRSTEAQNREIIRLAGIAGNSAPAALRQLIGGMERSALAANGVTISVNKAGQAVVHLPNGKTITMRAADLASPGIHAVENALANLRSKTVYIHVLKTGDISSSAGGHYFARAEGGRIAAGVPYMVGERGPELIMPDHGGFVMTASQTRRIERAAHSAGSGGYTGGRSGSAAGERRIVLELRGDLAQILKRNARVRGGGDVQLAFGGTR